ncbi:sensor histidine kinase [Clostridium tyrobutyricum]|uniref:sensor histidine kinase n=1 Tax=Clostridium tyrobutyricum TaxID=1519 RepID=UPI00073D3DE8|nr:HAMP domain-containing sensor histidine kinase [Clostridium tyrobutyricum]MBV4419272.1 HAMP domain-containing histidine kinase [Clostridium tyrobutyricum]
MKIFKTKSIMMKIWLVFVVIIAIIIFCISLIDIFTFRNFDENLHVSSMKKYHEMVIKDNNFDRSSNFNQLKDLTNIENFIVSFKGKVINMQYINNSANEIMPRDNTPGYKKLLWISSFSKNIKSETQFKASDGKTTFLIILSPIKIENSTKAYLITYMPYHPNNKFIYEAIVVGVLFIIIAFFTSKIVASYISKPLRKLEYYIDKIANKNWDQPIVINSNDEIGSLAKSMNIMQKKLKNSDENEKLFLQSISHDLKTPVMVIMSHAEAIIDGIYVNSVEKTAEIIKSQSMLLERKVNQILYLNTLGYSLKNNIINENLDLREVIQSIIHKFKPINPNINWKLDLESVVIFIDEKQIKVCLENILDNAVKYANTIINITLLSKNNFAVIEIYNDGDCIKSNNMMLLFNNIYKDKSGNFGLGLCISKKIVDFYNGYIEAINRKEGVSFILKYPID